MGTDCHSRFANWSRNDRSQEVQQKAGRDDVGSESSAASGRRSEMSEWPRSKFQVAAARQRGNFGHRNRIIGPYGGGQGVRWSTPQSRQSRDSSPCQGEPLLGTGDADCHTSDVGHWLAMTGCKKRGANPGGAMWASAPTKCNKKCIQTGRRDAAPYERARGAV